MTRFGHWRRRKTSGWWAPLRWELPRSIRPKRWKDMEVTCIMNIDMDVSACSCLADFDSDNFHADSPAFPLCFVLWIGGLVELTAVFGTCCNLEIRADFHLFSSRFQVILRSTEGWSMFLLIPWEHSSGARDVPACPRRTGVVAMRSPIAWKTWAAREVRRKGGCLGSWWVVIPSGYLT